MKIAIQAAVLASVSMVFAHPAAADAPRSQTVSVKRPMRIPGRVLTPGTYVFSQEDRLNDHVIVRISSTQAGATHLLLAVPEVHLGKPNESGIVLFPSNDKRQDILRGWVCEACSTSFEFVYLKDEAAEILADTGESILAADPVYDKLPTQLSAEDMKVITLWLLSPERVSKHRGIGLRASKYLPANVAGQDQVASGGERKRLPSTGSPVGSFAAGGVLGFCCFVGLRILRRKKNNASPVA